MWLVYHNVENRVFMVRTYQVVLMDYMDIARMILEIFMVKKTVGEWLEGKYIEWMARDGRRRSMQEFADWLDVPRPHISRYFGGTRFPSRKNVDKIAAKLGPEIYDLLGFQRPDPLLQRLQAVWDLLVDQERGEIEKIVDEAEGRTKNELNKRA